MTAPDLAPLEVLQGFRPHNGSLRDFLDSRVERNRSRPFLLFEGAEWSYGEFATAVTGCARLLMKRGIGPGDRIGVLSQNHPSTAVLLFALTQLGAILVPVNSNYGIEEAAYVFEHADIQGLFAGPSTLAVAQEAAARLGHRPWIMLNEPAAGTDHPCLEGELAGLDEDGEPPFIVEGAERTCVLIYTSGTTGFPKGVMHRQAALVLTGEAFVGRMDLQPDDRLLCVLPMSHANALFYSLCGAIACGGSLVLERRFSGSTFWQTAARTKATEVNLVAAAARTLLLRPEYEFDAGSKLRKAFIAPLSADMAQGFDKRFGIPDLIECYGMTEIPGVIGNPFRGARRIGSMGIITPHPDPTIPRPEARIVDEEFREVARDTVGELIVRTPTIMQGYFRAPDATQAAFRDGWFLTGDMVRQDEDGYYHFVARRKDIIRRRGENIAGAEIDRILCLHPAVAEAAAIGAPSAMGDEDILAVVVRRVDCAVEARDLADWVVLHLAPFKVPRYFAFVPSLPQTATQRVEKYKLRADRSLLETAVDLDAELTRPERHRSERHVP